MPSSSFSSSDNVNKSEEETENDFFGVSDLHVKKDSYNNISKDSINSSLKFKRVGLHKEQDGSDKRHLFGVIHQTSFGNIRYDSDNVEGSSTDGAKSSELGYIDSQFFDNLQVDTDKVPIPESEVSYEKSTNLIEEQYFGSSFGTHIQQSEENVENDSTTNSNNGPSGLVAKPSGLVAKPSGLVAKPSGLVTKPSGLVAKPSGLVAKPSTTPTTDKNLEVMRTDVFPSHLTALSRRSDQEITDQQQDDESSVVIDGLSVREKKIKSRPQPNTTSPTTAFDMAMKIRREMKASKSEGTSLKYSDRSSSPSSIRSHHEDSKGFWNPRHEVQDLDNLSDEVMIRILSESVIYSDADIVALNKPYGISVMQENRGYQRHSVQRYLDELEKIWHAEKLHFVHRIDKNVTGVMLLAKNRQSARRISEKFMNRDIIKRYVAITKGVPQPNEGAIHIPIGEGSIGNKSRMVLVPVHEPEWNGIMKRMKLKSKEAVTSYKVLCEYKDLCSLVQITPNTGVKHQIRCHLGFAVNCPILGDHKYSYLDKMVPQKLHAEILQILNLRQAKVRNLPLHLHSGRIIVPEYFEDGRSLNIRATVPSHFIHQLRKLKLNRSKEFY